MHDTELIPHMPTTTLYQNKTIVLYCITTTAIHTVESYITTIGNQSDSFSVAVYDGQGFGFARGGETLALEKIHGIA